MCGIVFIHRADGHPAAKMTLKRYEAQKTRGRSGFGYVSVNREGFLNDYIRAADETDIMKEVKTDASPTIMFHHRMPTSTPNFAEAAHPIKVSNKKLTNDFYVIHNGIISNADSLKSLHEKDGFLYTTEIAQEYKTKAGRVYSTDPVFNDSEVLAVEIAQCLGGLKETIDVFGSAAFVAIEARKSDSKVVKIHYGRNHRNPLKVANKHFFISITSEGEGDEPKADMLFSLDLKTGVTESRELEIGNRYGAMRSAGYSYSEKQDDDDWYVGQGYRKNKWPKKWEKNEQGTYVPIRHLELPARIDGPVPSPFSVKREDETKDRSPEDELMELYADKANIDDLIAYGKEQELFDETVSYENRLIVILKQIQDIEDFITKKTLTD